MDSFVTFLKFVTVIGGVSLVFYLISLWVRWLMSRESDLDLN